MTIHIKPVKLIKGHFYKVGLNDDTKTIYQLIRATEKGYKFLNTQTHTCGKQKLMYPSKLSSHTKNYETWFWLPANLIITEVVYQEENKI